MRERLQETDRQSDKIEGDTETGREREREREREGGGEMESEREIAGDRQAV